MENQEMQAAVAAKVEEPKAQDVVLVNGEISEDVRKEILAKVDSIKAEKNLKRVFAIIVYGDEDDTKPFYVGYFKRPDMPTYSRFMMKVSEDQVQASLMLAQATFVEGDKEMISDLDLFTFGTMNQLTPIIQGRGAELVKKQSVGK